MMLVLLLFMDLLVVDLIMVILFCTLFQGVKQIHVHAYSQNWHIGNILPQFKKNWLKMQGRIIYKIYTILMLTYKLYYNISPSYLCELINKKRGHVNSRLETDHHQLTMPPISQGCSNTFLERSFSYAAPCKWNKLSAHIRTSNFDCFRKSVKPMLFTKQYGC